MARTIDMLAQDVLKELDTDVFGERSNLSSITVDGVIDLRAIVRAVLDGLRDPSQEMLVAACAKANEEQIRHIPIRRTDAATVWQAMIDAILAEGNV